MNCLEMLLTTKDQDFCDSCKKIRGIKLLKRETKFIIQAISLKVVHSIV